MWACVKESLQYVLVFVSGPVALCGVPLIDTILILNRRGRMRYAGYTGGFFDAVFSLD